MAMERVDSYGEFLACQYGTRKRLVESVGSFDHKVEPDDLLPLESCLFVLRFTSYRVFVVNSKKCSRCFEIFDEPSRDWKISKQVARHAVRPDA